MTDTDSSEPAYRSEVETAVTVSVDIEADLDRVWDALVSDGGLNPWMGEGATLDPKPGGALAFPDPAGGRLREGKVVEVDPGRQLSYVWWPADRPTERSSVAITLDHLETGTRLTVVETPLGRPPVGFARAATASADSRPMAGVRSSSARSRSLIGTWSWRLAMVTLASQMVRV